VRRITPNTLRRELEAGIPGHRCVQSWLGYGEILYLGFGEELLPPPSGRRGEHEPPYQLRTSFSDWIVEERSQVRGTGDDPRDRAFDTCQLLLGKRAIDCRLDTATWTLTVSFEDDLVLKVIPLTDADLHGEEAWCFRTPAREYLTACCGGDLLLIYGHEPPP
jgi:hypothetical protein